MYGYPPRRPYRPPRPRRAPAVCSLLPKGKLVVRVNPNPNSNGMKEGITLTE